MNVRTETSPSLSLCILRFHLGSFRKPGSSGEFFGLRYFRAVICALNFPGIFERAKYIYYVVNCFVYDTSTQKTPHPLDVVYAWNICFPSWQRSL